MTSLVQSFRSLPTVLTHTYDPQAPFLANLCNLPDDEAEMILNRIRASGRRQIKSSYLCRRRETETWLIQERRRLLGQTPRARPIYFFLGDFADGLDASRPCSLVIPLDAIPEAVLTFTYPDSMASLPLGTRRDLATSRRPFHGHLFTMAEIRNVVSVHGLPERKDGGRGAGLSNGFIEAQVWDERPIISYLAKLTTPAVEVDQFELRNPMPLFSPPP